MLSDEDLRKIHSEALRAFRNEFSDHGAATSFDDLSKAVADAVVKAIILYDQLRD